jgi:hypothetical protein
LLWNLRRFGAVDNFFYKEGLNRKEKEEKEGDETTKN